MRSLATILVLLVVPLADSPASAQEQTYQGRTVKEWRVALKNADPRVRVIAALALGEAGGDAAPAIPELAYSLQDANLFVRRAAAKTLYGLGADAGPAVNFLTRALGDADSVVRQLAADALTGIGERAVPPLVEALKDKDYKVRALAAYVLDGMGERGSEAAAALSEAAKDPQALVRQAALSALAKIGPAARIALPALVDALRDKSIAVRNTAAVALIGIGKETIPAFAKALQDKNPEVRATAAQALGNLRDSLDANAVAALSKALTDENAQVRQLAAGCMAVLGVQARELVGRETVVVPLLKMLGDSSLRVRQTAVLALGQVGLDEDKDIEALAAGMVDADVYVRMLTVQALAQYTHDEAPADWRHRVLTAIARGLNDQDRRVQSTAAQTLMSEKKYSVPGLVGLLHKGKTPTRILAAAVLGEIGPEAADAVPALEEMSRESTALGKQAATFALARIRQ